MTSSNNFLHESFSGENSKNLEDILSLSIEKNASGSTSLNHNYFAKYMKGKYQYSSVQKTIFSYSEGIYKAVEPEQFEHTIKKELDKLDLPRLKSRDIEEIKYLIRSESYDEGLGKSFTSVSQYDLNLQDCILDVSTGQKRKYTKQEYKRHKFSYTSLLLESSAIPQEWIKFLHEVFPGYIQNPEFIEFLREYIAHLFLPITKYELGLFCYGLAGNGKSTFIKTINALLGEENLSHVDVKGFSRKEDISALFGKLANTVTETDDTYLGTAAMKQAISGEPVQGRFLYKDIFFFSPYARSIFASNSIAKVKDFGDFGVSRRFAFINFKQCFLGAENTKLEEILIQEKDKIFSRAMKSLPNLLKRGKFNVPKELVEEAQRMFHEQDNVLLFLEEYMEKHSEGRIYNDQLYPLYRDFCKKTGEVSLPQITLSRRLVNLGYKSVSKGSLRGFAGLRKKQNRENMTDITDNS